MSPRGPVRVRGLAWTVLGLLLVCVLAPGALAADERIDPCAPESTYAKGDGLVLGVAYWPGGRIEDWTNLNPCDPDRNDKLKSEGVVVAWYRTKVDEMFLMQSTKEDEDQLWERTLAKAAAGGNATKIITAVVFRGLQRSEARVVRSDEPGLTGGVGVVSSMAAVVRLEQGEVQYIQWRDLGCSECKGDAAACINDRSCAAPFAECTCSGASNTTACSEEAYRRCFLSLHVGFSGVDANDEVMTSGAMIRKMHGFSATALYQDTKGAVEGAKSKIPSIPGGIPGVSSEFIATGAGDGAVHEPSD
ncbi:unnamed protein product [Pedinophyceae sp. YPF-701]|nr:unnamed protein product [Pedinophyceae sp. YPF-701]